MSRSMEAAAPVGLYHLDGIGSQYVSSALTRLLASTSRHGFHGRHHICRNNGLDFGRNSEFTINPPSAVRGGDQRVISG